MAGSVLQNHILLSTFSGWATAQTIKTVLYTVTNKKFRMERMVGAGGMPSSHSAAVSAFATAVLLSYGIESVEFAFAAVLACIVLYDACGVRRAVGEHAKVLNKINNSFRENLPPVEMFKELIGHTPFQVFVGAIVGSVAAVILYYILIS